MDPVLKLVLGLFQSLQPLQLLYLLLPLVHPLPLHCPIFILFFLRLVLDVSLAFLVLLYFLLQQLDWLHPASSQVLAGSLSDAPDVVRFGYLPKPRDFAFFGLVLLVAIGCNLLEGQRLAENAWLVENLDGRELDRRSLNAELVDRGQLARVDFG